MPSNEHVIIDAANKGEVDDIEVLISTHLDAYHSGGLDEIMDSYPYHDENVYEPKVRLTTRLGL